MTGVTTFVLVTLLGGVGAATRFVVDGAIRSRWPSGFPTATVVVNVSGSLLLGLLTGVQLVHGLAPIAFTAAAVGFCGGYTTFSTAMVETVRLVQAGEVGRAAANALGTLVLCVGAAAAGVGLVWWTR